MQNSNDVDAGSLWHCICVAEKGSASGRYLAYAVLLCALYNLLLALTHSECDLQAYQCLAALEGTATLAQNTLDGIEALNQQELRKLSLYFDRVRGIFQQRPALLVHQDAKDAPQAWVSIRTCVSQSTVCFHELRALLQLSAHYLTIFQV